MPPVFGALTKQYRTVNSDTVDVFRYRDVAETYGVRAIPTILLTRAGREIARFEGPVSERTLVYHLDRLRDDFARENPDAADAARTRDATSPLGRLRRLFPGRTPPECS